ncbi:MAG: zinc dependent phospholipase C family protein [Thermodesulfobacteriota bacterium]|jgi:hypothetical protein
MKKLLRLGIFLAILGSALGPSLSQAFNSGAHVYIADQVAPKVFPFTFDKTDLYYGSIAPDISTYVIPPGIWVNGFCETHYEFTKLDYPWWNLIQKAFAQGWQIHNERYPWGADYWAHGTCDICSELTTCEYDGYVPKKAEALAVLSGISINGELAHFAIEVAIDLLLVDHYDHTLGEKLLGATLFRSPEDLKLLTKTFVGVPVGGTTFETLSSAETTFRDLVIKYAMALTLPEPLRMGVLGQLGVQVAQGMGVTIESADVQKILQAAIGLCEHDYYEPIQKAITRIISNKRNLIR